MITYHNGDILKSGADVICHQVNCQGVMGGGLAKQIRQRWPNVYESYLQYITFERMIGGLELGSNWLVSINDDGKYPLIVNMFAQYEFGKDKQYTDYAAFKLCCENLYVDFKEMKPIIAFPYKIGCGLAGGDWSVVRGIIKEVFADYAGEVQIWKLEK